MCVTLLGRRHLVNAYEVNAGWLIPFVDKQVKLCKRRAIPEGLSRCWSLFVECSVGLTAFHFAF